MVTENVECSKKELARRQTHYQEIVIIKTHNEL